MLVRVERFGKPMNLSVMRRGYFRVEDSVWRKILVAEVPLVSKHKVHYVNEAGTGWCCLMLRRNFPMTNNRTRMVWFVACPFRWCWDSGEACANVENGLIPPGCDLRCRVCGANGTICVCAYDEGRELRVSRGD